MDAHTLQIIEFPKVREILSGYAATSLGRELIDAVTPMTVLEAIEREQGLVAEMMVTIGQGQSPPFAGLSDVRLLVRRAVIGSMLTAEQILEVAAVLATTGAFYRFRMRLDERCAGLIELLNSVEDLGPAAKGLYSCVDPRGNIADSASPELAEIRQRLAAIDDRVQVVLKRLLHDTELRKVLRYPNATMSGDHFVLPVAANYRHKLPGVVHRTSPTGETVFIEPTALANLGAERAVVKGEEDRETKRILRRLTADIARVAKPLTIAIEILARVDLIASKAKYGRDFGMSRPVMNGEGRVVLRSARHPLLESIFRNRTSSDGVTRSVVPLDVTLGCGFRLLVVTGPNTGGKTVVLKTVGLLAAMAQSGIPIPAEPGSTLPVFDQILADIGDEQSLEQSLSTFSSHMTRIASILRLATAESLVLLDELGAGTDPTEGAALGRALLDTLAGRGCRAIVTTHIGDLKTYALANADAENAAVEFNRESLQPTYRLLIGQFGMSNALTIARRLQLPRDLIDRARKYLRRRRRNPELAKLHELRAETERLRSEAVAAKLAADQERESLRVLGEEQARRTAAEEQLRVARDRLKVGDNVRVARFDKVGKVVRVDARKRTVLVSVGLGQWDVPVEEVFPTE
ncbi:MAG: DNA strand exchange inhibitor protein [Gemmataceae bacterium]|nr:DNA strand exchange inhibitor protein [Gemmataceae bacterium]